MRFTILLSIIFLSQTSTAQSFEELTNPGIVGQGAEVHVTTKVLPWYDSLHYRFLHVEFSKIPMYQAKSDSIPTFAPYGSFSYHFSGPIILQNKGCNIYPIQCSSTGQDTASKTCGVVALFCIEDLDKFTDSLTFICRGYFGYAHQSQMHSMNIIRPMKKEVEWTRFEEDKSFPVATEEWFQNWRKVNMGAPHTRRWYFDKRLYCD